MAQTPPPKTKPLADSASNLERVVGRLGELTPAQLAALATQVQAKMPAPVAPLDEIKGRLDTLTPFELRAVLQAIQDTQQQQGS